MNFVGNNEWITWGGLGSEYVPGLELGWMSGNNSSCRNELNYFTDAQSSCVTNQTNLQAPIFSPNTTDFSIIPHGYVTNMSYSGASTPTNHVYYNLHYFENGLLNHSGNKVSLVFSVAFTDSSNYGLNHYINTNDFSVVFGHMDSNGSLSNLVTMYDKTNQSTNNSHGSSSRISYDTIVLDEPMCFHTNGICVNSALVSRIIYATIIVDFYVPSNFTYSAHDYVIFDFRNTNSTNSGINGNYDILDLWRPNLIESDILDGYSLVNINNSDSLTFISFSNPDKVGSLFFANCWGTLGNGQIVNRGSLDSCVTGSFYYWSGDVNNLLGSSGTFDISYKYYDRYGDNSNPTELIPGWHFDLSLTSANSIVYYNNSTYENTITDGDPNSPINREYSCYNSHSAIRNTFCYVKTEASKLWGFLTGNNRSDDSSSNKSNNNVRFYTDSDGNVTIFQEPNYTGFSLYVPSDAYISYATPNYEGNVLTGWDFCVLTPNGVSHATTCYDNVFRVSSSGNITIEFDDSFLDDYSQYFVLINSMLTSIVPNSQSTGGSAVVYGFLVFASFLIVLIVILRRFLT